MASNKHNDLYLVPPVFNKEAGTKMPPNPDMWSDAVFNLFSEQWPDLSDSSGGDVDWDNAKLDEDYGFGVGTITINSGNAIVRIPIIVKDFHLQPIDIFEADGKMQLLNDENIGAALKEQDSIGEVSYPSKTNFKSTKFVDWLVKGATIEGWNRRFEAFSKLAKKYGGVYVDLSLQCFHDAPIKETNNDASVVYFEKSGKLGELNMIGYNRGEVVQVGPAGFSDPSIYNNKALKEASVLAFQNGSSICPIQDIEEAKVGFIGVDATKGLGLIAEPGIYNAQEVAGDKVGDVSVFAMNILPFGSDKLAENPEMAFIVQGEDELNYAMQKNAVGSAIASSAFDFSEAMVPLSNAERYDKGFLIFDDGDKVKTSSDLITIDRIQQTPGGRTRIFMKTAQGDVHYLLDEDFSKMMSLSDKDKLYSKDYAFNMTGPNLSFLKTAEPVELVSSLSKHQSFFDDAVIKNARNTTSMTVLYLKDVDKISAKLGSETYEDLPEQFVARMLSFGVPAKTTATLIAYIKEGRAPVQVVGILPDKIAEAKMTADEVGSLMKILNGMREAMIKAAAAIEAGTGEEQAAAAVLGIGMIAEENLRYFLQAIPVLEDVTNVLARMLYSARLGDIQLDEGAIKSALVNITQIIGKLKKISARL